MCHSLGVYKKMKALTFAAEEWCAIVSTSRVRWEERAKWEDEEDYDCKFLFVLYESSPLFPREMMLIMMMVVVFCVSLLLLLILKHLRSSSLIEAIEEKFSKLSLIFNITNFHIRPISGPESSHLWNLKNQANNSAHHHEQWILIWKVLLAFCGVSNDEIYSLDDLNYLMDCDNHRVDTNSFW